MQTNIQKQNDVSGSSHRSGALEEAAELAGERVLEVGEEPEQGVLAEPGDLVPRVEHGLVLVRAGEGELDARAAVRLPALAPAARRPHRAAPVHAREVGAPGARRAVAALPEQVLEPALLELQHQGEAGHRVRDVAHERRGRPRRVLPPGEGDHAGV